MFGKLLLLFTVVPIFELYLLVRIGEKIGTFNTVAIVVFTGVLGASFAKSQGAQIFFKIRSALNQGQMPGRDMVQGVMILIGGILLVTPGIITDLVGFSLLIPFTRKLYADYALYYFKKKFQSGQWQYHSTGPSGPGSATYYEADFEEVDEDNDPPELR